MKNKAIEAMTRIQLNIPESIELKVEFIHSVHSPKNNSTAWTYRVSWWEDEVFCKTSINCFSPTKIERVNYA